MINTIWSVLLIVFFIGLAIYLIKSGENDNPFVILLPGIFFLFIILLTKSYFTTWWPYVGLVVLMVINLLCMGKGVAAWITSLLYTSVVVFLLSVLPVFSYTWGREVLSYFWDGVIGIIGNKTITLVALGIFLFFVFASGSESATSSTDSSTDCVYHEPPKERDDEEVTEKVEVWRMNGFMRENLKVSKSGDYYNDPDDGKWYKIKK